MNSIRILTIVVMSAVLIALCNGDQPSYQVSIYVNLHPKGSPVHLCNGEIIQSRLILTTASCLHYRFSSRETTYVLEPHMLQVVTGSNTEFSDELTLGVVNIRIANNFNFTTGENDLAILHLTDKLPLNSRSDMSWITLEDADHFEGPCLGNFYVRNTLSNAPNYIQSEELPLLDSEVCREVSSYPQTRKNDVCSIYMLPLGFNCQAIETLLPYNGDRGTGLVCENKLIALLSTVLPIDKDDETDCSDKPIKAFYTSLSPHLEWIYTIIGNEDLDLYEHGEYISSLAYAGENNAMEEAEIPVTLSTTELGSISPLVTTVFDGNCSETVRAASSGSALVSGKILVAAVTMWMTLMSIVTI